MVASVPHSASLVDNSDPKLTDRTPYEAIEGEKDIFVQKIKDADRFVIPNGAGVTTGMKQVAGGTLHRKSQGRYACVDGGIFRRNGFTEALVKEDHVLSGDTAGYDSTMRGLFLQAAIKWGDKDYMYSRVRNPVDGTLGVFKPRTLNQLKILGVHLAYGLKGLGLVKSRHFEDELYGPAKDITPITMMFPNREEFYILEQAANFGTFTLVPTYNTLGPDASQCILEQVQSNCIVCDFDTLKRLSEMEGTKPQAWGIKHAIILENGTKANLANENACLYPFTPENEELEKILKMLHIEHYIPFGKVIEYGCTLYNNRPAAETADFDYQATEVVQFSSFQFGIGPVEQAYEESASGTYYLSLLDNTKVQLVPPKPEDVQTICYTSGTTGAPKGVLITHKSMTSCSLACVNAVFDIPEMNIGWRYGSEDTTLSILPLAHIMERLLNTFNLVLGMKLKIFSQNLDQLAIEFGQSEPTIFCAVPRLLSRMYEGINSKVEDKGFLAKTLFSWGISTKSKRCMLNDYNHLLWDSVLFNKIRETMGGRLKFILSGAAPLGETITYNLESIFSCAVLEGYGMTEVMGAASVRVYGDAKGAVGAIMPCLELKLDAVPEMELTKVDKDQKGEICLRGNSVSPGYFRRPDLQDELSPGCWIKTGDIGQIRADCGLLSIKDRRKALFKLAQGEYISPEKIEGYLEALNGISQAFVTGNAESRFPVAFVVPSPSMVQGWTKGPVNHESDAQTILEWTKLVEVQQASISETLLQLAKEQRKLFDLNSFEIPAAMLVRAMPFFGEDYLTPTLKLKRNRIRIIHKDEIDQLIEKCN